MHKLDLPLDPKEAASIERRRNKEIQRQSRIFNARERTIGVDLQALEEQVKEKRILNAQEKRKHDAFANEMLRNEKLCLLLQKRQENDIREINKSINEFRKTFQSPENRREFDIYDPNSKKKDKPARVSDDDSRCGVSSMQKFTGEDLDEKSRKKFQQEQNREWINQQVIKKKEDVESLQQTLHLLDLKAIENDQRSTDLSIAEQESRKAINLAVKNYNLALAEAQKHRNECLKKNELENNLNEIKSQVFGDFLTENPDVSKSAYGSHRVITDRWKGMSPNEISIIKMEQEKQLEEKLQLMKQSAQEEDEWNQQILKRAKAAMIMEQMQERKKKDFYKKLAEENCQLAASQKSRLKYMNEVVYTNQPTPDFFAQFNTSSR
ncbi:RIB43A-like with coiled-coils protein 2 [Hydra vulgaris]|uniref:RIB43A-like with coiled-coils protein 2 n=1 Tax=Hydra vulgaris TaxID=6087 RepID=T2M5N1_HYDVU|nr:RIB43A-like with coiled-coils protein 2 [Hydra vulgaris]